MLTPLAFPLASGSPLISAHRGALNQAPENTFAAFDTAVSAGADMIELDLHPTRDGRLVVIHDVTTTRTTGRAHRVQDLTNDQISALEAGSWFGSDFAGERIPTLEEVLRWAKDRVYLNLDIRHYPALDFYRAEAIGDALLEAIDQAGVSGQVVLQCPDHQFARFLHRRSPDVAVGITQHGRPVDTVAIAQAAGAVLVSGDTTFATADMVTQLRQAGIGFMTSAELRLPGVPEEEPMLRATAARLRDLAVDIVVTDDVAATRRHLRPGPVPPAARTDHAPVADHAPVVDRGPAAAARQETR
ncbi:glycerophosphodiester phosphodiesterase [Streptomyces chiangmaiensis]|uniref:Glycerophosphodiester phosphodiesterase family protein n=1 Tax=Streptomyces chiangmaiensis TaxID=766497 RepID=A0ABU7FSP5_9ACTN|nr:glycerophosphodiester phosphodiesterase family protein [Streptomyces chiangmaiensis]MED7827136.1 glycerophosphodiester phosphodiesterase family protein [Streptomyces chiangmaiensis]